MSRPCPHGDEEVKRVVRRDGSTHRVCLICQRLGARARRARQRAERQDVSAEAAESAARLLASATRAPSVLTQGLCAQTDPEIFFPEKGHQATAARKICADCPVRAECLTWAMETREPHGVWGGLTERDRAALRTKINKEAA